MNKEYPHSINKYKQRFVQEHLKDLSVSMPEAVYLSKILDQGTVKMSELIQDLPFHKSHATRSLAKLEEAGLIDKRIDPEDQRGYIITLKHKGITIAQTVRQVKDDWDKLLYQGLSPDEAESLERIHEKIYRYLTTFFQEDHHEKDV